MEPSDPVGAWGGAGGGPSVLLRAVHRTWRLAVSVHGRRYGGYRDVAAYLRRWGSLVTPVAAVSAGLHLQGVDGRRMREARLGRSRHRRSLRPVLPGFLVRCFCDSSHSSGERFSSTKESINLSVTLQNFLVNFFPKLHNVSNQIFFKKSNFFHMYQQNYASIVVNNVHGAIAGCILVSGAKINQRGEDKAYNDNSLADLLVPVPP